jgi:acetyltransferase
LPIFSFPEQAIDALAQVWQVCEIQKEKLQPRVPMPNLPGREKVKSRFQSLIQQKIDPLGWLPGNVSEELLNSYGIATVPQKWLKSFQEGKAAAEQWGYPVVLKAIGPQIIHKSELGGVLTNLKTPEELARAFREIQKNLQEKGISCQEFLLQKMIKGGVEVVVGASFETGFGHLMMCGSGGVTVELYQDLAFALHPLNPREIRRFIRQTKVSKRLNGYRGSGVMDQAALEDLLMHLSILIRDFPNLGELDLNPIKVLPKGQGALVLDHRFRFLR